MASGLPPNESIRPQLAEPWRGPVRVVIEQPRSSWFARAFKWLFMVLLFFLIAGFVVSRYDDGAGGIQEEWHSLSKDLLADKVAIVSVSGTILTDEGFVKSQLDRVRNDDRVKAIVLRVDSPGGT